MLATFFVAAALTLGQLTPWMFMPQGRSMITGRVLNPQNRPVENARVTLQNDAYSHISMVYTDGAGRYRFSVTSGTYNVLVEPAGTDFERQSQRVEINPIGARRSVPGMAEAGGGEIVTVDFILSLPRGGKRTGADAGTTGTVFYQKIPDAAKTEFLKGVKSLETNAFDDAVAPLKRAIEIFPDYYDALEMLGTEYVRRGDFPSALPLLTRAVEVNKNGYGYYPLGVALIESKRRDEGIKALQRAVELFPNSINANMRLGKELARDDQRRAEAIKAMETVTRLAGKRVPEAYLALASLYSKNQQYREAADAMEIFLQTIPESDTERRGKMKSVVDQLRQKAKNAPPAATSNTAKPSKQ